MPTTEPSWEIRVHWAPVPKPRMSQRDRWLPREVVQRYWAYADALKWATTTHISWRNPTQGPVALGVDFHLPFPKSYSLSKRRGLIGKYHAIKPDLKNLVAGVEDSLNRIAWSDDAQVVLYNGIRKFWTDGPGLTVIRIWAGQELSTGYQQDIHREVGQYPDETPGI